MTERLKLPVKRKHYPELAYREEKRRSIEGLMVATPEDAWNEGRRTVHDLRAGEIVAQTRHVAAVTRRRRLKDLAVRLARKGRAAELPSLGQGLLGDASVAPKTLRDYVQRVSDFWRLADEAGKVVNDPGSADWALTEFANFLFARGELCGEGDKLKAAFEAMYPEYSRVGKEGLPRLARALKGWRKLAPHQTRLPLPEECIDVITGDLLDRKRSSMALALQLMFSAYLRPSECIHLGLNDVIPPVKGGSDLNRFFSLLLAPFERQAPSKTNTSDQAILLDDSRAPWLGMALGLHCASRRRDLKGSLLAPSELEKAGLWTFTQKELLDRFRESAARFGLLWLCDTLYVLRHGGASRDALGKLRNLPEIMQRGWWAVIDSVKHYEKHARVQRILHKVGESVVRQGRDQRLSFSTRFRDT